MGKISKPQKSSKHKKIKAIDPFYVGKRTADRSSKEANQRPNSKDEQEFPHSLREMMFLKKQAHKEKQEALQRKKDKTVHVKKNPKFSQIQKDRMMEQGMSRPIKPVPRFVQGQKESKKAFMNRVERETQAVLNKSRFEDKFNVEIGAKVNGKTEIIKPVNEAKKIKDKERLKIKKEKKKEKKSMRNNDKETDDFSHLKDKVEFGEVAMEPPTLTAKPRNAPQRNKVSGMLLAQGVGTVRETGKVQKRKHMSMAQQVRLDEARELAIQLYRKAKDK